MKVIQRIVAPVLAALALLPGSYASLQAGVVNHLLPFGLTPGGSTLSAVAFRLPAGGDFSYVGLGIVDGPCIGQVDCLLADRGWLAMPTVDNHVAAASGPGLAYPSIISTSWAALRFSADPVLSPSLDLDVVLFGTGQQLLGGYHWLLGYDGSAGYYRLLQADYTQWVPTWDQIFAVPQPGTLPLVAGALAALVLLSRTRRPAAQGAPMNC
jgi:hypothetical protein